MERAWVEWFDARPVNTSVDLSRPGKFTAPLRQTCEISHGEAFYLVVEPPPAAGKKDETLLEGLDATVTVKDGDGNQIESLQLTGETRWGVQPEQAIRLACFKPFANGDYTVAVDVRRGAPDLAGRKQTLHAGYLLCGMERFPGLFCGFAAIVCGIPGLIVTAIVATGFVKYGVRVRGDGRPRPDAASE